MVTNEMVKAKIELASINMGAKAPH